MGIYEHDDIEEFCTRLNEKQVKDVGIRTIKQEKDAGNVIRGNNLLPGKYIIAYATLTAIDDKNTYVFQELVSQATIATQKEFEQMKAEMEKREKEIVEIIQKNSPKVRIFSGQVRP